MAKWLNADIKTKFGRSIYQRYIFVVLVFGLFIVGVVGRIGFIYQLDPTLLTGQQKRVTHSTVKSMQPRGLINDRFGYTLALSVPKYKLWIDSVHVDWDEAKQTKLAKMVGWPENKMKQWFVKHKKSYAHLGELDTSQYQSLKQSGLKGLHLDIDYQRYYSLADKAAHLVGRTDHVNEGIQGLEYALNSELHGQAIASIVKHDRKGRPLSRHQATQESTPAIMTTIDHRVQFFAAEELEKMITESEAESGSVIVLSKRGDILAMVNAPSFDPNKPLEKLDSRIRNRAFVDLFEPGSVVKPLAMAVLLPEIAGKINALNTSGGRIRLGKFTVSDTRDHGRIKLDDVIKKSSNVAMIKLAQLAEKTHLIEGYKALGLFDESDIHLYGEPVNQQFSQIDKKSLSYLTASYGYGFQVSLLRMAHAYLILANHGVDPGLRLLHNVNHKQHRVVSAEIAKRVNQMLLSAVSHDGTGHRARIKGVHVSGKTGTAHIQSSNQRGYVDKHMASFIGFAPTEEPQYVVAVQLNEPKGMYHFGSRSAAPLFKKVMEFALNAHAFQPILPHQTGALYASTKNH